MIGLNKGYIGRVYFIFWRIDCQISPIKALNNIVGIKANTYKLYCATIVLLFALLSFHDEYYHIGCLNILSFLICFFAYNFLFTLMIHLIYEN